jgi:hypothetical protein
MSIMERRLQVQGIIRCIETRAPGPIYSAWPKITSIQSMLRPRLVDRQVGRNAQLFAASIARLESPDERYPYLRILISIIEQAHPEWTQSPNKHRHIVDLVRSLSDVDLDSEEISRVIDIRDAERNGHVLRNGD